MKTRKSKRDGLGAMTRATGLVDQIAAFEDFQTEIVPMLRKDLAAGMDAPAMRAKYQALVTARQISTALADPDSSRAMAAAKDILDRHEGKATERKEITHRLGKLSDNELDAIVATQLDELEGEDE